MLRLVILVFALLGGLLFLGSPTGATGAAPPGRLFKEMER